MASDLDGFEAELTRLARRVDSTPECLAKLEALRVLARAVKEAEREAVVLARGQRRTWSEIGVALGVTKQAAAQRYPDLTTPVTAGAPDHDEEKHEPRRQRRRAARGWDVTTPGGRTLLKLVRR